jgi:two-component system chemotaxis response regulator CheB
MYTVLVVDDSLSMRRIISDFIDKLEDFEVVDTARDAYEARDKIKDLEPDLVTIDLNMPKMDGYVFLRNLMKLHPMPAVIISNESSLKNDIFDDGAVGFIAKPVTGESMSDFAKKIEDSLMKLTFLLKRYTLKKPKAKKALSEQHHKETSLMHNGVERKVHPDEVLKSEPSLLPGMKLVAIGSSTGGVDSLIKVFSKLEDNLCPIIISQHIPYGFSASFAQRLNDNSKVEVFEAQNGMILKNGCAYLSPGNMHLTLEKSGKNIVIKLLDTIKVSRHKPSINIMFRSVNNTVGSSAMAIMMTGMGDDGSICMKELYDNGAYTVAQDEASCVVFGMPKVAIEIGAVRDICPLDKIAQYIIEFSKNRRR